MLQTEVSYWLDAHDRICKVAGPWDEFARRNDGEEVVTARILGRPLEEFIVGEPTRMYMGVLLDAVRLLGHPVEKEYRCDSPTERRFMRMWISRDGEYLRVDHWILRTESKPGSFPVQPADPGRRHLLRCSVCNRYRVGARWVEDQDLPDPTPGESIPVVYAVCPDCGKDVAEPPPIR
jgi:hypothetical protein